jgi:hypothetical protein
MVSKEYHQKHYQENMWLYKYKSRIQRNSLKNFDFDETYNYFLWKNRPLKADTIKKKLKKIKN